MFSVRSYSSITFCYSHANEKCCCTICHFPFLFSRTRFKDEFLEAQKRLTLEGNIVISVGLFGHSGDEEVWSENTKPMLDDMHLRKIDLANEIFVVNPGGYIGSSTRREIEYALRTGADSNKRWILGRHIQLQTGY